MVDPAMQEKRITDPNDPRYQALLDSEQEQQDTESRQELEAQVGTISEELAESEAGAIERVSQLTEEQIQEIYAYRGQLAQDLERSKGEIRQQKELVERRRDLISYNPRDVAMLETQQKIQDLDKQTQEIEAELAQASEQINYAEAEALADIAKQVTDRKAELDTAYQEALTTIQQFEDSHIKLDTGDWIDKEAYNSLDSDLRYKLQSLGIDGFNNWITDEQAKFQNENMQLQTGEWFNREDFYNLSEQNQFELINRGVENFNKWLEEENVRQQTEIDTNYILLNNGDYVSKEDYETLGESNPELQRELLWRGVNGYNQYLKDLKEYDLQEIRDFITEKQIPSSEQIRKYDIDLDGKITSFDLVLYTNMQLGKYTIEDYNALVTKRQKEFAEKYEEVAPGQYAERQAWQTLQLTPAEQAKLQEIGDVSKFQHWLSISREVQEWGNIMVADPTGLAYALSKVSFNTDTPIDHIVTILRDKGYEGIIGIQNPRRYENRLAADFDSIWNQLSAEEKAAVYGNYTKSPSIMEQLTFAGEIIVPGFYVARNWSDLSTTEKAGNIILDLLVIVPATRLVSGVVRGTRLGVSVPRAIAIATKEVVIGEIRAPIDAVLHPKQLFHAITEPLEIALKTKHIPIESLEIRFNTVRIPIKQVSKAGVAMVTRDELVDLAIKGEMPRIVLESGKEITLTPVALQKAIGEAAVHGTVDIRPFLKGATIGITSGRDLYIAPTLSSRFTYATAGGRIPKGALPGALLIRDKKVLDALKSSGRTYAGTVEIEEVLKAGYKLPAPSQVLTTRTLDGRKLQLLVIGEPISQTQIAKLKLIGAKDLIRDIFTPSYRVDKTNIEIARMGPYASDTKAINATAKGTKPISEVLNNLPNRTLAKLRGLKVIENPLDSNFIIVFKDTPEGLEAYNNLIKFRGKYPAETIASLSLEEQVQYHTELGRIYGYSQKDIDLFVNTLGKESVISKDIDRLADIEDELTSLREVRRMPVVPRTPVEATRISTLESEYTEVAERINRTPETARLGIVGIDEGRFLEDALYEEYATRAPEEFRAFIATLPRAEQERIERVARADRELINLRAVVGITRERIEIEPRTSIGTREPIETRPTIPTREPVIPRITREPIEPRIPTPPREPVTPPRIPIPPIPPPPPPGEKGKRIKDLTSEQLRGAIGWKQGIMYKVIYPPYEQDDIINSRQPIEGIKYYSGARSAYESLVQTRHGELPPTIHRDMGIMDVNIVTTKGKKPKMRFSRDENIRRRGELESEVREV